METKINDLTVNELQDLISKTVRETIEDAMEDFQALMSANYLKSIEEARRDYKEKRVKSIDEV